MKHLNWFLCNQFFLESAIKISLRQSSGKGLLGLDIKKICIYPKHWTSSKAQLNPLLKGERILHNHDSAYRRPSTKSQLLRKGGISKRSSKEAKGNNEGIREIHNSDNASCSQNNHSPDMPLFISRNSEKWSWLMAGSRTNTRQS